MTSIFNTFLDIPGRTVAGVKRAAQDIGRGLNRSIEWVKQHNGASVALGVGIAAVGAVALPLLGDPIDACKIVVSHPKMVLSGIAGLFGIFAYRKGAPNLQNREIHHFPNGDRYKGEWVNGIQHGQGTLYFADGDRYKGEWVDGNQHGQGTYYFANGDRYEGGWVDGQRRGQGTYYFASGARYEGGWVDGNQHGQGTLYFSNGDRYEGGWVDGQRHGQGTLYFSNGDRYEGGWVDGQRHGQGTYYFADKEWPIQGNWQKGILLANRSYLNHPAFLSCLLDKTLFHFETSISILADYFEAKGQYPSLVADLHSTLEISLNPVGSLDKILDGLSNNKPRLLPFRALSHAMLLEIVPSEQDFIFKVYNSGDGLQFSHDKDLWSNWVQTALQILVPKASVGRQVVEKLLDSNLRSVKDAYKFLLELPGARKLKNLKPVLQIAQKGENCTLECVFAYLKNKLGEEQYHQMRMELFDDCIRAINDPTAREEARSFLPKLNEKKAKRMVRNTYRKKLRRYLSSRAAFSLIAIGFVFMVGYRMNIF